MQVFPRAIRTTELPSNPSPRSTRDGAQPTFRNNQIQILQTSSTLGTTQPWQPTSQSGRESVQLPAVHHCCGANRGRIVSLQRYSSPFINLSPFFRRKFGPERKHACSLQTKRILLRHHAHPCLPFHGHLYMGLYTYYKHFKDKY